MHVTPTELHVLVLLIEGETHEAVAFRMGITPNTVKRHLQNIYDRFGTGSLVGTYRKLGWLKVGPVEMKSERNSERPRRKQVIVRDKRGRFAS